jgi:hypothetical protein
MTNNQSPMTNDKSMAQLSKVHPGAEGVVAADLFLRSEKALKELVDQWNVSDY